MSCCDCSTIEGVVYRLGTELQPNILYLYTGAVMRDLAVEQHSTWNGLVLNHPYRANTASTLVIHQRR